RIRTQLKERKETLKRKTALSTSSLPAKLVDCHGSDFDATELILVEGDSAMGSARAARDASFQALLPLRGKVLNTWRTKEKRMLENAECAALISAVGAGAGRTFNLDDSRYSKVVIMTDADVDGSHIRALLVTFFCAYMRPLAEQGRLYAAVPPLHKIVVSGQTEPIYTVTETERADVLAELEAAGKTVKETMRFKGLGEMSANQLAGVLDPEVRTLRRINLNDELEAETMLELLMGSKVEPRRNFILEAAEAVDWDTLDL
ncbi:MAG: toprim domain-containing protein, partial [Acidimicrobiales bacterium]|nr:toprim domain-containing protein [Acidimicrobiales bacterium]